MDSRQVERIRKMEEDFNRVREVVDRLERALNGFDVVQRQISRLTKYQVSGQWLKDFEADERGELPQSLARGVLSEDGLSNLLDDIAELHSRMKR